MKDTELQSIADAVARIATEATMKPLCGSRGFAGASACILHAGHEGPHEYGNFDSTVLKAKSEELKRLRAENAALRADAERFAWLSENCFAMDAVAHPDNFVCIWFNMAGSKKVCGKTLAEAVDIARKK